MIRAPLTEAEAELSAMAMDSHLQIRGVWLRRTGEDGWCLCTSGGALFPGALGGGLDMWTRMLAGARPLDEAKALERAVEALRAAGYDIDASRPIAAIESILDQPGESDDPRTWNTAVKALCALHLVCAGYSVTPPTEKT